MKLRGGFLSSCCSVAFGVSAGHVGKPLAASVLSKAAMMTSMTMAVSMSMMKTNDENPLVSSALQRHDVAAIDCMISLKNAKLAHRMHAQIALQFPDCFWGEELDYFGATRPGVASSRGQCFMFWSLQRFCGAPVLLVIVSGDAAYASEGKPLEEMQEAAMQVLRKLFGDAVPLPTACDASQWVSDEYTRGEGIKICALHH